MTARVGKIKITRDGDRVRLERVRGYRSVSDRIGQKAKADRLAKKWQSRSKPRT